ncbi:MAG: hypothetical protein WAT93_09115 [Pontixanthobacter sp.]
MKRWLAVSAGFSAIFASHSAAAQDAASPDWAGVFEGKIGRYPVIACFDQSYDEIGFGSYYYLSQLKPIPLESIGSKSRWAEGDADRAGKLRPIWQTRQNGDDQIVGTWRSGARRLPINLTRMPAGAEEYDSACAAANFLYPRVVSPEFTSSPKRLEDFQYTILDYKTPAHFASVSIAGFTFDPVEPGDKAIVGQLAAMLPAGTFQDDYMQCMAGLLGFRGVDGDYEREVTPKFANSQLLSFQSSNSVYCGGAYPSNWRDFFVYDRQSGLALDPVRWFNAKAVQESEYGTKIMQEPLRQRIIQDWPADGDCECSGLAETWESWAYQLLEGGVNFQPQFPHVAQACQEEVFLNWDQLQPFLSEEGRIIQIRAAQ